MNKKWLVVGGLIAGAVAVALVPGAGIAAAVGAYKKYRDGQREKAEKVQEAQVNEMEQLLRLGAGC
jgi:hypothetical protein